MNPGDLQRYLHDRIPLARAMEVEVRAEGRAGRLVIRRNRMSYERKGGKGVMIRG